jgi:hypothetical protein
VQKKASDSASPSLRKAMTQLRISLDEEQFPFLHYESYFMMANRLSTIHWQEEVTGLN